jgi:hypothetical protein
VQDILARPKVIGCLSLAFVDIKYGKVEFGGASISKTDGAVEDPRDLPPAVDVTSDPVSIPATVHYTAPGTTKPNLLPNGMPFDPPYQTTRFNEIITVRQNLASAPGTSYRGTINNDSVTIAGRTGTKCFYCRSIDYSEMYWNKDDGTNVLYYAVTVVYEYNPLGMGVQFPLVSFQAKFGSDVRDIQVKDIDPSKPDDVNPVNSPQKITSTGTLESKTNRENAEFMGFTETRYLHPLLNWVTP